MYGGLICLGILVAGLLFMIGVFSQSYMALAIPVTVITLTLLGLAFWVGWTIYTIKVEPPKPEEEEKK